MEGKESRRLVEAGPEAGGLPCLELPGGTHRLMAAAGRMVRGRIFPGSGKVRFALMPVMPERVAVSPAAWCVITKTHTAVRPCRRRTGMCR